MRIISILLVLFTFSCSINEEKKTDIKEKEEKKSEISKIKLSDLYFMEGNWKDISGTFTGFNERWIKEADSSIKVIGYTIQENDTSISEVIKVKFEKGILFYSPRVVEQNEGKVIHFGLSSGSTIDSFAFTNYNHDFPREIIYKKSSSNMVKVNLNGVDESGKEIKLQLLLQKSN